MHCKAMVEAMQAKGYWTSPGGGALIDPRDENHYLRADPRDWDDEPCEEKPYGF